ncbi:MAG: hypothetical protein ACYTHJ_07545 [Planctomycetota bacterium]|jgi:hypothetical protein
MAEKPENDKGQVSGVSNKRVTVQLLPVKYKVTLVYLGEDRIKQTLSPFPNLARNDPDRANKDPHDDTNAYRCKYALQDAGAGLDQRPVAKPHMIPNAIVVTPEDTGDEADAKKKAAKPAAEGGDCTNPPDERNPAFRIMITDNHGMRSADQQGAEAGLLHRGGNPDGDTVSKPANYATTENNVKANWLPDVSPAVPFRVVVRKFVGNRQHDYDEADENGPMKVEFEIKDPIEEFDRPITAAGNGKSKPQKFLEKFFGKYHRDNERSTTDDTYVDNDNNYTGAQPVTGLGDDNALGSPGEHDLCGQRRFAREHPGVKATDVLKKVAYASNPEVDTAPADAHVVSFSDLQDADASGDMNAAFPLVTQDDEGQDIKDENDKKVAVADVVFLPKPVCGDNYRFLITIRNGSGEDIRTLEENGAPIKLVDHRGRQLDHPYAYTTGRLVIWRKMIIKLVAIVNEVPHNAINWAAVRDIYKECFLHVQLPRDPQDFYHLRAETWLRELWDEFTNVRDRAVITQTRRNLARNYQQFFFPRGMWQRRYDASAEVTEEAKRMDAFRQLDPHIVPIVRRIITHACRNVTPRLRAPASEDGRKQDAPEGFFILLMRPPTPHAGIMGSSFGDRMFWFVNHPGTTDAEVVSERSSTSSTCSHEAGHALYLRHAHTQYAEQIRFHALPPPTGTPATAPVLTRLVDGSVNNRLADHDQEDAYSCLMAYTRSLTSEPCAVCRLALRFFDRVKLQDEQHFESKILDGLAPVVIVGARGATGGIDDWHVVPNGTRFSVGRTLTVMALGKQQEFTTRQGTRLQGRVNISAADDNMRTLWGVDHPDRARLTPNGVTMNITTRAVGTVNISYQKADLSANLQLEVVP